MCGMKHLLTFSLGAAVGAVVTWRLVKSHYKNYYEQIAREEIESVKEVFSRNNETSQEAEVVTVKVPDEKTEDLKHAIDIMKMEGYDIHSEKEEKGGSESVIVPYVIAPEEFGDNEDYEEISLTYYADKVLTDDMDQPVENIQETVGLDFHKHFGEYEDDSVFIRNDELRADYEILLDVRNYSDVKNTIPNHADEE